MRLSRIFFYGGLGVVTGLLLENKMLDMRRKSAAKRLEKQKEKAHLKTEKSGLLEA